MTGTVDEFYAATNRLIDIALSKTSPTDEARFAIFFDASSSFWQHEAAYLTVLSSSSNPSLKSLATATIPKYFVYFPKCQDKAMDCHLDLCEDDDAKIRRDAIRGLPLLCKDTPRFVPKVADVLCQLLQTDLKEEEEIVKGSLIACWSRASGATSAAIFQQAISGVPDVQTLAVKFLVTELSDKKNAALICQPHYGSSASGHSQEPATPPSTPLVVQFATDLKRLIETGRLNESEIKSLCETLGKLAPNAKPEHFDDVLSVYISVMEANGPYDVTQVNSIKLLQNCLHSSVALYKRGGKSTLFLSFLLRKALVQASFDAFPNDQKRLLVLRITADSMKYKIDSSVSVAMLNMMKFMLTTHSEGFASKDANALNFHRLECILYCLYELVLQFSDIFDPNDKDLIEQLKGLYLACQARLTYLATDSDKSDKKCIDNVFLLVKEMLKPLKQRVRQYVLLSWHKEPLKPVAISSTPVSGIKRSLPSADQKPVAAKKSKASSKGNGPGIVKEVVRNSAVAPSGNGANIIANEGKPIQQIQQTGARPIVASHMHQQKVVFATAAAAAASVAAASNKKLKPITIDRKSLGSGSREVKGGVAASLLQRQGLTGSAVVGPVTDGGAIVATAADGKSTPAVKASRKVTRIEMNASGESIGFSARGGGVSKLKRGK